MDFKAEAEKYINGVLSGKIIVSEITKKTYIRHRGDLANAKNNGWVFDAEQAVKKMKFKSLLRHTKGRKYAGKKFILEPWQCAAEYVLFGWFNKKGTRRFTEAYIEIPKKNGKTAWAAAIADELLIMDKEPGAEVYFAATKKDQARIGFNQAKAFIQKNPELKAFCKPIIKISNVSIPSTESKMEPLGRDSYGLDGINPTAAIIDEYHEWSNNDVRDSIESGSVSRPQSLEFIITTAGYNKTWPCYQYRKFILDILLGAKEQDNIFGLIYTIDEGDDWRDQAIWKKANPNYGISVEHEKMVIACKKAMNEGGSTEVTFKTKNLNVWVDAPTVWIQDETVQTCNHGTTDEMLIGATVYAGLDLASHVDINALALYFPDVNGHPVARLHYWIPESKVEEHGDRVDYRRWQQEGRIHVTEGNVIDIDTQTEMIYQIVKKYNCRNIAFDPAKAYHGTIQNLQKKGLSGMLDEFPQNIKNMSEPTRTLEKLVQSGEIDLMRDPVLRWMFRNAVAVTDTNDNIKLDKKKSQQKIDGLIALINAIGGYMSGAKPEIYKNKEVKTLNF